MINIQTLQIVAAFIAISQFIGWLFQSLLTTRIANQTANAPRLFRLITLKITGERAQAWRIVKLASVTWSSLVLALLLAIIITFAISEAEFKWTLGAVATLIFLFGLPIFLLVDTIVVDRKWHKVKRTRVFKSSELELIGNYDSLFGRCQQVISSMGARFISLDYDPGTILAKLPSSSIRIKITRMENGHYKLSIISDSTLPSVRFDFGRNSRNIDEFTKRLLGLK